MLLVLKSTCLLWFQHPTRPITHPHPLKPPRPGGEVRAAVDGNPPISRIADLRDAKARRASGSACSRARRMCAGAFAGEPLSNGGCGSYSMPSWIACATSSPAICAASVERHVDARRHAGRGDDLALLDDALARGLRAVARAARHRGPVRRRLAARRAARRRRAAASRCTPTSSTCVVSCARADPLERARSSSSSARVPMPPGTTRMSGVGHVVERGVGDEREHAVVGAHRARLGATKPRSAPGRRESTS